MQRRGDLEGIKRGADGVFASLPGEGREMVKPVALLPVMLTLAGEPGGVMTQPATAAPGGRATVTSVTTSERSAGTSPSVQVTPVPKVKVYPHCRWCRR